MTSVQCRLKAWFQTEAPTAGQQLLLMLGCPCAWAIIVVCKLAASDQAANCSPEHTASLISARLTQDFRETGKVPAKPLYAKEPALRGEVLWKKSAVVLSCNSSLSFAAMSPGCAPAA